MWDMSSVFVSNKSGWLSDSTTHINLKFSGLRPGSVWGLTATPNPPAVLYLALLVPSFAPPNHLFTDTPLKYKLQQWNVLWKKALQLQKKMMIMIMINNNNECKKSTYNTCNKLTFSWTLKNQCFSKNYTN